MGLHLETYTGNYIYLDEDLIESMNRSEIVWHLEQRGTACYDDESTELLRECLLADYRGE